MAMLNNQRVNDIHSGRWLVAEFAGAGPVQWDFPARWFGLILVIASQLPSGKHTIKGPDNPTSQLLPKMSFNGFSGDREGRKDNGGGERSRR